MSRDDEIATDDGPRDNRRVFRLVFDVLATDRQVGALKAVIGEALCAGPDRHEGPCRIAWSASHLTEEDAGEEEVGLSREDIHDIRMDLAQIPTWDPADVDRSLSLAAG